MLVLLLCLLPLALPASAAAAVPELLWKAPPDGVAGADAGRLDLPNAIAADPGSGHVYIAEGRNGRVSEFDAWGQFVKAWGWGVADGAPGLQSCGPGATPPTAGCLKGTGGSGPGQFGGSGPGGGIGVDAAGAVYVADMGNLRVQKFSAAGQFLLTFGGEVNKTNGGDVCTAASGDVCGAGLSGEGDGEFTGGELTVGPAGTIFVGGAKGRIQEFNPDGSFKAKVILEGELGGASVDSLAIDGDGNFYVTAGFDQSHIYKFSPTGALLTTIDAEFEVEYFNEFFKEIQTKTVELQPESPLALDAEGNLFAAVQSQANGILAREVIEFDSSGELLIGPDSGFAAVGTSGIAAISGLATNPVTAGGASDIYTTVTSAGDTGFAAAYGPPPEKWPPPVRPPQISAQYATGVDPDAASLRAEINPRFWEPPFSPTTYRVEYGTGKCSEGGCPLIVPDPPGTQLGAGVTDLPFPTAGVSLVGLAPATTYHFRFVAESGGGGPVYGIAPEGGEASAAEGLEGTFTTPAIPPPLPDPDPCVNAIFRSGASAYLADCRAYEMVTPVDKDGGEVLTLLTGLNEPVRLNQGAASGERLTYSSYRAFADPESAPAASQYIAERVAGSSWTTDSISPPRGTPHLEVGDTLESQFRAFTEDLCKGWIVHDTDPGLTPDAVEGFPNLYGAEDYCGGGVGYEALTRSEPPGQTPAAFLIAVQGISADGSRIAFRAPGQLTVDVGPSAAAGKNHQCYESFEGKLRLISILPNGTANTSYCSLGTSHTATGEPLRFSGLDNAVSEDGSRIFWSASEGEIGDGKIYVRIKGKNPTVAVSAGGEASSGQTSASTYLTAAADGSKAIYMVGSPLEGEAELYEFDVEAQTTTQIAGEVRGILGASEDASRIYLVSTEARDAGAVDGKPNLYLYEAGSFRFVATLANADAAPNPFPTFSAVALEPNRRAARVSPDGQTAAFMSTAPLTGYDNTDVQSGRADSEVFRYDATADGGAGELVCVSCNPSGARPTGRVTGPASAPIGTAARIPGWEYQLHPSRVLSEDGDRLFFESFEALVVRDTNEKQDVYQWEEPGTGSCSHSSPAYSPPNGGCLSLISSGQSSQDSSFVDASSDGSDVFFATASSLLSQDPGLIDIYDARELGGLPPPPPPAPACQGEACQNPGPAPQAATPASSTFRGPGDLKPRSRARRCPPGKRRVKAKGKARCAKGKRQRRKRRVAR